MSANNELLQVIPFSKFKNGNNHVQIARKLAREFGKRKEINQKKRKSREKYHPQLGNKKPDQEHLFTTSNSWVEVVGAV